MVAIITIIFTVLIAIVGSSITTPNLPWYYMLNLPSWTPTGSFIGIVWTTIYILTAISAIIVLRKLQPSSKRYLMILLFILNGLLNVFWSYLFFTQHLLGIPILEMLLLNATTIALAILAWSTSRLSSILLWPYIGWVTFATYLAWTVWQLNT